MGRMDDKLSELLETMELAADKRVYERRGFWTPYPKQKQFFDQGSAYKVRYLSGGNQTGKTDCGGFEFVCHALNSYPADWAGKKFDRPVRAWVASPSTQMQRDAAQKKLMGEFENGTGFIPKHAIVDVTMGHGTGGAIDQIRVKTATGGISQIGFKNYEQKREVWQGETLDFLWYDEEPPLNLFGEGQMRLKGDGMAYITATPLNGMSDVASKFFKPGRPEGFGPPIYLTLDDVPHYTEEQKKFRISMMSSHEREARRRGVPSFGSGRVFDTAEETIREEPIQYPPSHWRWLWGLDFGLNINHPFAAVLGAHDRDTDLVHIVHTIRMADATILQHCRAMSPFGWIKAAWPQDGTHRDRGDLTPLAKQYKREGIRMCPEYSQFEDGSRSTEAGITEMESRFSTGRLKVAKHLEDWFEEYRLYHRDTKTGLLVKKGDDLMSATRTLIMDLREASVRVPNPKSSSGSGPQFAIGHDDPPW
jgi:phage terminase large subunit-like protein